MSERAAAGAATNATAAVPTPHELGQRVDPARTPFAAGLQALGQGADRDLARRLLLGLWESDPVADDVVVEFSELPDGAAWPMLDRALDDGLDALADALPALRAMLEPILDPPDWVNCELLDAGCVAYCRAGPANAFAGALSLSYGYAIPRTAKILLATGRIEEMAGKRLVETGQWLLAATAPGNMRPDRHGSGIAACIRVRLVHAYVRRHMLAQEDWDVQRDAIPLNATDLAATLNIGFYALHIQGVEKLGIRYSPGEKQAMAHMWRWVAHVLGVSPDLQPLSYEHARSIQATYEAFEQRTDTPSAKLLTAALLRQGLPQVAFGIPASRANDLALLTVPFTSALLAYMLGPQDARLAGLARSPLTLPMHAAPLAGRAYSLLRASGLLGDDAAIAAGGHALMRRLLANTGSAHAPLHPETAVSESRTNQHDTA
jgi:ER-bound oxygenase mpaB/B'/Rubber oxygenase, catalytic domain